MPTYTYDSSGNLIPTPGATGAGSAAPDTMGSNTQGYSYSPMMSSVMSQIPAPAQVKPPADNLQTGAQGPDVAQLQNYLIQMGYLQPQQVSGEGGYNSTPKESRYNS